MLGEIHKTGQNKSLDLLFFQLDLQWLLKFPNHKYRIHFKTWSKTDKLTVYQGGKLFLV